jgi:predicted nucleic acid-binding protein
MNAIDTNLLVYAFDLDETIKGPKAVTLIESAPLGETVLLWQVACELSAVLTRIGSRSRNIPDRRAAIDSIRARFPLIPPTPAVFESSWRLRDEHQMSFWDALLLAACLDAGVTRLYTEDLQSRPVIEGVEIVNPFA